MSWELHGDDKSQIICLRLTFLGIPHKKKIGNQSHWQLAGMQFYPNLVVVRDGKQQVAIPLITQQLRQAPT